MEEQDGGFVIFSGNKLWYSSKEGIESNVTKTKVNRTINKVRNSAKVKRVIEFQLFEDIKNTEKDPYWYSFFEDAAIGKLPRNVKFISNILSFRNKNKLQEVIIPDDIEEAKVAIKLFLFDYANIISPDDLRERKEIEEHRLSQINCSEINSWNQIKNEKQQSILISIFSEKIGLYYKLNLEERKTLIQRIKIGILSGYLNSGNIDVVDSQIIQIHGLEFNPQNREFVINTDICKVVKPVKKIYNDTNNETFDNTKSFSSKENEKKSLIKNWNRYILDVSKKYK